MLVSKEEIARLIPHTGAMCLLDGVEEWDATHIRCVSGRHRDPANPMRVAGQLPALCGVEFAAQAMAVHGGLAGAVGSRPKSGYLAALRDVTCLRDRMDDMDGDLVIDAEQVMGNADQVIYRFTVAVGDTGVLRGRATVILAVEGANL